MKRTTVLNLFVLAIMLCTVMQLNAQVTIGSSNEPSHAALLDLNQVKNENGGVTADSGGLLFPRVALEKKGELLPFYKQAWIDANILEYMKQKLVHTGLMVYNVTDDSRNPDGEGFIPGIFYWDGGMWIRSEKGRDIALFTIENCNGIRAIGEYADSTVLGSTNYLTMSVTVTRIGSYTIEAASDIDNGYFFTLSGEFLSTGTFRISVPGMGMPWKHTDSRPGHEANYSGRLKDTFKIMLNRELYYGPSTVPCEIEIPVKDRSVRPMYQMDCSATQVFGDYLEEERLNSKAWDPIAKNRPYEHCIKLVLQVNDAALGSNWEIHTNEVDGIKFSGSGVLEYNSQTVFLKGEGVPFDNLDKQFHITTNSELTTSTCVATVFIIIPSKRMLTISGDVLVDNNFGYNLGYLYPPVLGIKVSMSNNLITDESNFGPHAYSIVRYAGFKNLGTNDMANVVDPPNDHGGNIIAVIHPNLLTAARLGDYLFGRTGKGKIDIVTIGYNFNDRIFPAGAEGNNRADTLIKFMQQGGILLMFSENNDDNALFLRRVFNKSDITTANAGPAGSRYYFGYDGRNEAMKEYYAPADDPIIKGPFGDLTGTVWGEDASVTRFADKLPVDQIYLYSSPNWLLSTGNLSTTGATIFRHQTLPFVWCGDGGFNSSNNITTLESICPFKLAPRVINGYTYPHFPTYRQNFGPGNNTYVRNAVFTANAIAWCIMQADVLKKAAKQNSNP